MGKEVLAVGNTSLIGASDIKIPKPHILAGS